jgi:acetate kinase
VEFVSDGASQEGATVLALNSGSSSLKLAVYSFHHGNAERLLWGAAEEIGGNGRVWLRNPGGVLHDSKGGVGNAGEAAGRLLAAVQKTSAPVPVAIGHRIVHGGPHLREHQPITPRVLSQLKAAVTFAPLHLPPALDVIHRAMAAFPGAPQVACFDTAFHRTLPEHAARLPLAGEFYERGFQRYGFHGLSCESAVRALGDGLPPRAILAHLGNGCSLTAILNRQSIETTMGLTPTGGVMMGTRTGDLDPGVCLTLLRTGYDASELDSLVNRRGGLLGVSAATSDMRRLLELRENDAKARLAIEMFCYRVRKSIGALAAALGGLDMLIFTGGIGEHAPAIRAQICSGLEFLRLVIDSNTNERNAESIASGASTCDVRVIAADEDLEIALHTRDLALN